jgi:hypothetical protein
MSMREPVPPGFEIVEQPVVTNVAAATTGVR